MAFKPVSPETPMVVPRVEGITRVGADQFDLRVAYVEEGAGNAVLACTYRIPADGSAYLDADGKTVASPSIIKELLAVFAAIEADFAKAGDDGSITVDGKAAIAKAEVPVGPMPAVEVKPE